MQKAEKKPLPEWWQRGAIDGIIPELQPVAHAILQARDEVNTMLHGFPEAQLWKSLYKMASVAFHLQHIVGVLDRLFTYAKGQTLSESQMEYLSLEGKKMPGIRLAELVQKLNTQVDRSIEDLKTFQPGTAGVVRTIGRKKLPSTEMGLLFHAAEHTMRHTGQLMVTVGCLKHFNPYR